MKTVFKAVIQLCVLLVLNVIGFLYLRQKTQTVNKETLIRLLKIVVTRFLASFRYLNPLA